MPVHIIVKDMRTMDMTIDQQVALDEALVPHASRLRIGKSNFCLRSDITSKELTLQLVYDVLRLTPFYKAFLVTADVPEIYMQEFWATATVHHYSIRFKMDNKKRIVNLEYLGHSGEIRKLTDGMYYKKNIDFAYLLWEEFVYQVEHKDAKKSNEMYYPRFTKVIIHFFMTKDPSIPRRNKVNWHYGGDDQMFTTIKLVLRHQNTQQFGVMFPVELTNEDIRNSEAYKEYYAIASGATPPKTKESVRKTKSSSDTTITPPTIVGTRLSTSAKGKQLAKSSKEKGLFVLSEVAMTEAEQMKLATKQSLQQTHISQASRSGADEGTGIIPWVLDVPTDESDEEISWKSSDEDDDDEVDDRSDDQEDDDDQDDDDQDDNDQDNNDDDQDTDNDGHDFVHPNVGLNVGSDEGQDAEDDDEELYRDVNIETSTSIWKSSSVSSQFVTSMLNLSLDAGIDSLFESTSWVDVQTSTTVASLTLTAPTLPPPTIPTISQVPQAPTPPTTAPSTFLHDLPNFDSLFGFDHRLKTLEANFSEFVQTNQFAGASDRLQDEAQAENEEFLNNLDEDIQKIIKEQVKEQVKSIHRFDEQRNLYKALVDAYESDKIILDTYGDTVTLKRRRDDADKDEESFAGSDRGSIQPWISDLAKQANSRSSFNELMDTLVDFSAFLMNRLKVDTLTPELLAGLTYELMKGSCKSLVELKLFLEEVYKAITDQLDWNNPEGQQYPHNLLKPLPLIPNS
uniref:Uncharacterized protein n=1 Tax=Tanacetum cinerariifolium TaxID=118510 RepID=A0A699GY03_TANCI|nr:hypothetical protein [Tanacetum cinerariifolium]